MKKKILIILLSFYSFSLYASDCDTVGFNGLISVDSSEYSSIHGQSHVCEKGNNTVPKYDIGDTSHLNKTESNGRDMLFQLLSLIITSLALIVAFRSFKSSSHQAKKHTMLFWRNQENNLPHKVKSRMLSKLKQTNLFVQLRGKRLFRIW